MCWYNDIRIFKLSIFPILLQVPDKPDTWPLAQLANRLSPEPPVWEPPPQIDRLREKIQGYCPAVSHVFFFFVVDHSGRPQYFIFLVVIVGLVKKFYLLTCNFLGLNGSILKIAMDICDIQVHVHTGEIM